MRRRLVPFSEVPQKNSVSSEYFFRMMSPTATKIAERYINDEVRLLENTLESLENSNRYNLVVVAGGQLGMVEIGLEETKSYTEIEPLADEYIGKHVKYLADKVGNIHIVKKILSKVNKSDLPKGKNIFVFTFNILAYIENPIKEINHLINSGDVLFISTWSRTPKAVDIRKEYFDYLNSFEKKVIIDPEKTVGICNLESFPFTKLNCAESHKLLKTDVVEVLEIKLNNKNK